MALITRCFYCKSDTGAPNPKGWLYVKRTPLVVGEEENFSFCCWQCLVHYGYDQRPSL